MKQPLAWPLFALVGFAATVCAQISDFRVIGPKGTANIVFCTSKIEKGKEKAGTMATKFTSKDPIWARAYFPGEFGELEDEGFIDVWIDGTHEDVVAKNDDSYKAVYLAESDFTYVEEP